MNIPQFLEANKGNDTCWIWSGAKDSDGTPAVWFNGVQTTVRAAVRAALGIETPAGFRFESTCKNKLCANPNHAALVERGGKKEPVVKGVDFTPHEGVQERFDKHFTKGDPGECWLWHGAKTKTKYGFMWCFRNGVRRTVFAHRIAYALKHGMVPGDKMVCHKCDVKLCVNPDHLFLGTAADNNRDCIAKGRDGIPLTLTWDQVSEIRDEFARNPNFNRTEMGKKYGVTRYTIMHIISGKTWKTKRPESVHTPSASVHKGPQESTP